MTKKEVYNFIRDYDLFQDINFEDWFEDAVFHTTDEEDVRLERLEKAIDLLVEFTDAIDIEVANWVPQYDNQANAYREKARKVKYAGEDILFELMEDIIEIDYSLADKREIDFEDERDAELADYYHDLMKAEKE